MKKVIFEFWFFIVLSILCGCSQHTMELVGHDTLISTRSVNLNSKHLKIGQKVTGIDKTKKEDGKLFKRFAYQREAINNALEQNPCAVALVDVVYKSDVKVFDEATYIVEGYLLLDGELPGCDKE